MKVPVGRAVLATLLLVWIGPGPLWRTAGGRSEVFIRWHMFSGFGSDICDVRFTERRPDGSERPIDRYHLLQLGPWYDVPIAQRQIKDRRSLRRAVVPICAALGPEADVRVYAQCGTRWDGWSQRSTGGTNQCSML